MLKIALTVLLVLLGKNNVYASDDAEEARWLVQTATWGTLSWLEEEVSSMVTSIGEHDGSLFINIPFGSEFPGSITISEAQLIPDQFEGAKCGPEGDLDPEDPRCAKLTLSGKFEVVDDEETKKIGQDALFASHPAMKDWPTDHGFTMLKLNVQDLWMIANFGGGGSIPTEDYYAATPAHHPVVGFGNRKTTEKNVARKLGRPEFASAAAHARWLVSQSLWTTISTDASSRLSDGVAWGNIRSVTDGECIFASTGLPVFYLPKPDPTSIDVLANSNIALSFTEASLPELIGDDGQICGGADPEDPTCAKISLHGTARVLGEEEVEYSLKSFGTTHPRASWLASGGAHTGGSYYTIELTGMEFFRNYGGMATISVDDYLNWKPDYGSDFDKCEPRTQSTANATPPSSGEEHMQHGSGEGGQMQHGSGEGGQMQHGSGEGGQMQHGSGEGGQMQHGSGEGGYTQHGSGEGGGEEHGSGEGGYTHGSGGEMHSGSEHSSSSETQTSSLTSSNENVVTVTLSYGFLSGTVFGFMLWGPTIALLVYHKLNRGQNYAPIEPTGKITSAQIL